MTPPSAASSPKRCEIQKRLLPQQVPQIDGWELAVSWQPASGVGGDCFDTIRFSDTRLAHLDRRRRRQGHSGGAADVEPAGGRARVRVGGRRAAGAVPSGESHPLRQHRRRAVHQLLLLPCSTRPTGVLTYTNAGHYLPMLVRADGIGRAARDRRSGARRARRRRVRAGVGRDRRRAIGSCSSPTASPRRATRRTRSSASSGCSTRCRRASRLQRAGAPGAPRRRGRRLHAAGVCRTMRR